MKSNGFGILYERGEKLEKLLNHHETNCHSPQAPSCPDILYGSSSENQEDEGSSISDIEHKGIEVKYKPTNDVIKVDDVIGNNTQKSLESVLNYFNMN